MLVNTRSFTMPASPTNHRSPQPWLACLLLVLFPLAAAGCAQKIRAKPEIATLPAAVGEIAIVNLAQRFVLIDVQRARLLPAIGAELKAEDATGMESARLKVTPERRHPFITADIVSGTPARGEKVYR